MAVFLLSLCVVAAIALGVYGSTLLIQKVRKDNKIESTLRGKLLEYRVLGFLLIQGRKIYRKNKNMEVPRIKVIQEFNLMPEDLNSIVSSLEENNLVISDIESIAITPFGIEYYNSFIKPKRKK